MLDKIKGLRKFTDCAMPSNENELRNKENISGYNQAVEDVVNLFSIGHVSGSADADYWSERCKHAENILEKSPCAPDITDEQIEAHNGYHNFIKENGGKYYR